MIKTFFSLLLFFVYLFSLVMSLILVYHLKRFKPPLPFVGEKNLLILFFSGLIPLFVLTLSSFLNIY